MNYGGRKAKMSSGRGMTEDDRVKLREEAKKERMQLARAAKLPHVQRNEYKVDHGFVSRKVQPDDDDAFSISLKNGLIDYREVLSTREDYRFLGIDNGPATPEVDIAALDDHFKRSKIGHRINGFKRDIIKEEPPCLKNYRNDDIKKEPSSPKSQSSQEIDIAKDCKTIDIKEEPASPKIRSKNTMKDPSNIESNGEIELKNKSSFNPKAKPPVLTMPSAGKTSNAVIEKTPKPHQSKIESILKVQPDDDDAFSISLKNGLIDYREVLSTREDYRFLGIDNGPATPEVDIAALDDHFKRSKIGHRINGFKRDIIKEEPPCLKNYRNDDIKKEPSSPKSQSSQEIDIAKDCKTIDIKEEPASPKIRSKNTMKDPSNIESNGEIELKNKSSFNPKAKPPVLTMPSAGKTSNAVIEKTPKPHQSKIESILKEMTESLPPLTDIQTPVKSHDTRFPFPQIPPSKENSSHAMVAGKQHCAVKPADRIIPDLSMSDDDSDDEHEKEQSNRTEIVPAQNKRRLSASSSSSSSDGSSSDSSSDSDSSDSESEGKNPNDSRGRTAMKTPAAPVSHINNNHVSRSVSKGKAVPQSNDNRIQYPKKPADERTPRGKVMREEQIEKQVSPLNSKSKDVRRVAIVSPLPAAEPINEFAANVLDYEGPHFNTSPINANMSNVNSVHREEIPMKKMNDIPDGLREDSNVDMNSEFTNVVTNEPYEALPYGVVNDIIFDAPSDPVVDPHVNLETFADIINDASPSSFGDSLSGLPFVSDTFMGSSKAVGQYGINDMEEQPLTTVNLDPLNLTPTPDLDTEKTVPRVKTKKSKKVDKGSANVKSTNYNTDTGGQFDSTNKRKNSSSTLNEVKPGPSKKDAEQEWFKKLWPASKNHYDLPPVNPEMLKFVGSKDNPASSKVSKPGPMKISIPLCKVRRGGKQGLRVENTPPRTESPKKQPKVAKEGCSSTNKKKAVTEHERPKKKLKIDNNVIKKEKPRVSVGKDMEQIKSLMAELSNNKSSDDEDVVDVISTPSPLKCPTKPEASKPEARVSGKTIRGTPASSNVKKDLSFESHSDKADNATSKQRTKASESSKKKKESSKSAARKRTNSSLSHNEHSLDSNPHPNKAHKTKHAKTEESASERTVNDSLVEHYEESSSGFKTPSSSSWNLVNENKFVVKINLMQLRRVPGIKAEEEEKLEEKVSVKEEEDTGLKAAKETNPLPRQVWKPPPNIKIPKLTKRAEVDECSQKNSKPCTDCYQDSTDMDSNSNCSSTSKPIKETVKEKKGKRPPEGRGVKRKDWERCSKNANSNPNVCGMCGCLQKDTGRDPIRLGTYKTSYGEYLTLGTRAKHIADCLDPSERTPKYIDAVLKYIQYLVGLEITGKTSTKNGMEDFMCITSQCIDLVAYVLNLLYGKKENNNISSYDERFVYLCLRLQSVLYFKLFVFKKDSAARYSKLLSQYFKTHRSPHRVSIKGSTGTPSPMSPTSSHTGSVNSYGSATSSVSNGSYEKMMNVGSMVPIPAETLERMQQYFTYTKYLLHGHRLWDEAESISSQCQEFINIVSRRVGAINIHSSMLHLVDYISAGLEVIKDSDN